MKFARRQLRSGPACPPPTACSPLRAAFTLIEMVLVLLLISAMMMLAAPSLAGWGQGAKLDDAAGRFVAAARYARSQAIAEAKPYRLQIDNAGAGFQLFRKDGESWVAVQGVDARYALPTGFTIRSATGAAGGAIDFDPSARTTPATLDIVSPRGYVATVACEFPTDLFRVVQAGGGR